MRLRASKKVREYLGRAPVTIDEITAPPSSSTTEAYRPATREHALDQTAGTERPIIRMRGDHHEPLGRNSLRTYTTEPGGKR